jgi:hypothetical protein
LKIGYLSSSKQCQLKDFKETIYIPKPYVTEPLTLCFNRGKDIVLLVSIEGFFNHMLSCLAGADMAMETSNIVNKEAVKKLAHGWSGRTPRLTGRGGCVPCAGAG